VLARDLSKLATLAVPLGIRIAYEALSWGKHVNEFTKALEIVSAADRANLGLALNSFHMLAAKTGLDDLDLVDPRKLFIVQLADFMWRELPSPEERLNTVQHFRVFPGEGVHGAEVVDNRPNCTGSSARRRRKGKANERRSLFQCDTEEGGHLEVIVDHQ
jgi:sugar phosphate isomerase/epimerase